MAVISKEFMSILNGALREDLEKAYDKIEKDIDMADIVERLRRWSPEESTHELLEDAATEIERLRERVAALEATLEGALDSCKIWERILTKALGEKE